MRENNMDLLTMKRIIVGSPVYQKPEILDAFLKSLSALRYPGAALDFIFIDDNEEEESRSMLSHFHRDGSTVTILRGTETSAYVCDGESHHWNDSLMLKVARYKNTIIEYAVDHKYDGLFFVDSDLILHPDLIRHLEYRKKEIVSEIFWSRWHEGLPQEPNVWLFDEYDLVPKQLGEELDIKEKEKRQADFMEQLRRPGLYEVGGLGACTLIRRSALLKGVSFAPIPNLTIHGEDRFFCIRAAVLGIGLFVDTCFPAYHIYREPDLTGVSQYIKKCETKLIQNRVTLSMSVRNEEGHYLKPMLESLSGHIDSAVIIDDASTDRTAAMCRKLLGGIPLKIITNRESMFGDEIRLRKKQWDETIMTNPDWILNLDADEILEESFWDHAKEMLDSPDLGRISFRLYDMWNETQYREDRFWSAHKNSRTFLLRYDPGFRYQWRETPQHCGRFPVNCDGFPKAGSEYRVRHLGWSTPLDRERKYNRYRQLDPGAVYGVKEQYDSILDQNPRLITWQAI